MFDIINGLSDKLFRAYENIKPIPKFAEQHQLSLESAYTVQKKLISLHRSKGRQLLGYKIGMTNPLKRNTMGAADPTCGVLFRDYLLYSKDTLSLSRLIQPRVEAEIAFLLQDDLKGPNLTLEDVLKASIVMPALEIIDSRIENWQLTLLDGIADNCAAWGVVLGEPALSASEVNLRTVGVVFEKNGELLATAAGAASLDHPGRAVQWLANRLALEGVMLQQGQVILSGALTDGFPLEEGVYRAEFGNGLGVVELQVK